MQTQYVNPKLLFQFYKSERVPPLVKKYDFESHFQQSIKKSRKQQIVSFGKQNDESNSKQESIEQILEERNRQLERQVQENRELRLIIKELQEKIQHLMDVNQKLCIRVEDLEKRNQNLAENAQTSKRQITRKVRLQVYKQIEEYLRLSVQKFTQIMLPIKMSPIIENKLQSFLEEILNINNLSVRQALNPQKQGKIKNKSIFDQKQAERTIKQIISGHSKSKSKQREKNLLIDTSKYGTMISKLRDENSQIKPGTIRTRVGSPSRSGKRPRIFNQTNQRKQRSNSKQIERKLDF